MLLEVLVEGLEGFLGQSWGSRVELVGQPPPGSSGLELELQPGEEVAGLDLVGVLALLGEPLLDPLVHHPQGLDLPAGPDAAALALVLLAGSTRPEGPQPLGRRPRLGQEVLVDLTLLEAVQDELVRHLEPPEEVLALHGWHGLESRLGRLLLELLVQHLEQVEPLVGCLVLAKDWSSGLSPVGLETLGLAGLLASGWPATGLSRAEAPTPGHWIDESAWLDGLPGCHLVLPAGAPLWHISAWIPWIQLGLGRLPLEAELPQASLAQLLATGATSVERGPLEPDGWCLLVLVVLLLVLLVLRLVLVLRQVLVLLVVLLVLLLLQVRYCKNYSWSPCYCWWYYWCCWWCCC